MQVLFVLSALPVPTAFSESEGQGSITTAKGCLLLVIGDVTEEGCGFNRSTQQRG